MFHFHGVHASGVYSEEAAIMAGFCAIGRDKAPVNWNSGPCRSVLSAHSLSDANQRPVGNAHQAPSNIHAPPVTLADSHWLACNDLKFSFFLVASVKCLAHIFILSELVMYALVCQLPPTGRVCTWSDEVATDGWTGGWMDGWADRWKGEWMNGQEDDLRRSPRHVMFSSFDEAFFVCWKSLKHLNKEPLIKIIISYLLIS